MATEGSPFKEEQELEESLNEELLALLASALLFSVSNIVNSQFDPNSDLTKVEDRFRSSMSEAFPTLYSTSQDAINLALERASRELGLKDLTVDRSDQRLRERVSDIFERHMQHISETNRAMFRELRNIALENGWTDAEFARRLKDYIGLTPKYINTVLTMENALVKEGVKRSTRQEILSNRINRLVDWRLSLIGVNLSTEIVEGSKDAAYSYLIRTNQVSIDEYEKEWRSVLDENTTQICTSSHRMRARIGQAFANGLYHPPAYPPVHPCRSAITLVKRII